MAGKYVSFNAMKDIRVRMWDDADYSIFIEGYDHEGKPYSFYRETTEQSFGSWHEHAEGGLGFPFVRLPRGPVAEEILSQLGAAISRLNITRCPDRK